MDELVVGILMELEGGEVLVTWSSWQKYRCLVSPRPPESRLPNTQGPALRPSTRTLTRCTPAAPPPDRAVGQVPRLTADQTAGRALRGGARKRAGRGEKRRRLPAPGPPDHERALRQRPLLRVAALVPSESATGTRSSRLRGFGRGSLRGPFTSPECVPLLVTPVFAFLVRSRCRCCSSGQLPAGLHDGLGGVLQTAGRVLRADVRAGSGPRPGVCQSQHCCAFPGQPSPAAPQPSVCAWSQAGAPGRGTVWAPRASSMASLC